MSNPRDHQTDPSAIGRVSRRGLMVAGAGTAGAAALTLGSAPEAMAGPGRQLPNPWHIGSGPFTDVRDGRFVNGRKRWRFGGTNCYYLHVQSHYMIDSLLDNAGQMNMAAVRAWAFSDGASQPVALQPKPYSYPDDAYDSLDYTIYKAGQLGIKLVLPLVNNWPDYGGMAQYVSWFLGLPDDSYGDATNHDRFYTDPDIQKCFRAYIRQLVNRVNRYTGLRYRDDPTIMTWELANEPRNRSDKTGKTVLAWADRTSRYVKDLAPHQLVSVGDEGFGLDPSSSDYPYGTYEGNHWQQLTGLPAIDYGTVHLYPQSWGETADPVGWGTTWITDHIEAARKIGKPVVLEEFGLKVDPSAGVASSADRDDAYRAWLSALEAAHGDGFQFWILTALTDAGVPYEDYDGFRVTYPSSTASIMTEYANQLARSTSSR